MANTIYEAIRPEVEGVATTTSSERAAVTAAGSAQAAALSVDDTRAAPNSADSRYNAAHSVAYAADIENLSPHEARTSAAFKVANSAALWDSKRLKQLHHQPAWAGAEIPAAIAKNHEALLTLLREKTAWAFWLRFYEGMWNGTFDEWDLAFEVIQIDEADWAKGYEHIGDVIAGIEARMLAERTPLAEEIILDVVTERFRSVPIPIENSALIQTMINQVNDDLTDALGSGNGLREAESFVIKLRRANTKYQNDPQRLELDYTNAAVSIRRLLDGNELDRAENNLALLDSVEDGVRALRANHPDIAANREQLAKQKLRQLDSAQIALLEDAGTLLPIISEDVMSVDFAADIPQLINDAMLPLPSGAPPLPGADETTRIFFRVSRMKQILDGIADKGAEMFDSKGFKTARFGFTVASMLTALVALGTWVVGVL